MIDGEEPIVAGASAEARLVSPVLWLGRLFAPRIWKGAAYVFLAVLWARCYASGLRIRLLQYDYALLAVCVIFFVVLCRRERTRGEGERKRRRRAVFWLLASLLIVIAYLTLWKVSQITATWGFGLGILCTIHVFLHRLGGEAVRKDPAAWVFRGFLFAAGSFLPGFTADGDYDGYLRASFCGGMAFGTGLFWLSGEKAAPIRVKTLALLFQPMTWLSVGVVLSGWLAATEVLESLRWFFGLMLCSLVLLSVLEIRRIRGVPASKGWIWAALAAPPLISVPWLGP